MGNKVLIVEDEAIIAQDTKIKLETNGYTVVDIVDTGKDAVDCAIKYKPDIVLMDVLLDGTMNGFEAADIIRKEFRIPILFLSAHSEKELMEKAATNTSYSYLVKPMSTDELLDTINQLLNHNQE